MIRLIAVKKEDKDLLFNINQKYLYEMTLYYPDKMDEMGNLHYGFFEEYFVDENRKAFFIYNDALLVGFAMMHPYSVIGGNPDYTLAEFCIFPSYRRKGFAVNAVNILFDRFKGKWEIKYNNKNLGAKKLWTMITSPYNPKVCYLNEEEVVLEFTIK